MTEIRIYPFTQFIAENILFFAKNSGLTLTGYSTRVKEDTFEGAYYIRISVNEILTQTQKDSVTKIFTGLAFVVFN